MEFEHSLSSTRRKKSKTHNQWDASSLQAAVSLGRGTHCARVVRQLTRTYIKDREILPINPYGVWNSSMVDDKGLAQDLGLYLQELGDKITPEKVVEFLARDDIKEKHGIARTQKISICTAQRYLNLLGYWFTCKEGAVFGRS
jgi:hypothetical protein